MGEILVTILVYILFGFLGGRIAEGYGRKKITGIILGVLFGVWALVGYIIVGPKK